MTLNRVADLRRVGGLRYNFDTEQPTLLDIETVDSVTEEKRNSAGYTVSEIVRLSLDSYICIVCLG